MAEDRLKIWEVLFQRALELFDSANAGGARLEDWSFGGDTVLMRRHHHRFSKDIDIFVPDPQYLGLFNPRISSKAESLTTHYLEQSGFLKLYFPEGEIDFVASGPLTENPTITENLFGHDVRVETSTEIVAKKIWHRGIEFTARDIFDLAMVAEKEPEALVAIRPILRDRRQVILDRIAQHGAGLREVFDALETLDYKRSFDECVALVTRALDASNGLDTS
ncbi:MAG: nucleotidyl transferase AbiEii/AbiGii toxin family protein [Burkholderiales bacterium]|nr:nucleotidyl transferase AbiEii/AbiGii toxin family protein [Burkholderiales bacterium]